MSKIIYLPIVWMMMELNAPTWVWIFFWVGFALDTLIWILKIIVGKQP